MKQTQRLGTLRANPWRNLLSSAAISVALSVALAACSSIPGTGPRTADIVDGAKAAGPQGTIPYVLIDLDQNAAQAVGEAAAAQRAQEPIHLPPGRRPGLVGPGDLLRVAVWEPNPTGTSLAADKTAMETITRVDIDGTVSIPFVGRLRVAGQTPAEIESAMHARLASQSPNAQVAVLITEDVTNNIIVQGQVAKPGRYEVVPNASGLLDILAMAGGPQTVTTPGAQPAAYQPVIRVTRAGISVTRTLSNIVGTHALEADLAPGDRVLVQPREAYFYAFGAVNVPGAQPYDTDTISLTRTLARIAGLADSRADPAEVFIYRRQAADLTRAIMPTPAAPGQDLTRVIYRLNLRAASGFFISQAFPVLPDDLVYVSESPISEAAKVFQIVTGISAVGGIPRNLGAPY
jgi:polysaccharide export outer membrane protein